MIRNTMLGLSLLALTTGSALAATPAEARHQAPHGRGGPGGRRGESRRAEDRRAEEGEEGQEGEGPEGRRHEDRGREGDEGRPGSRDEVTPSLESEQNGRGRPGCRPRLFAIVDRVDTERVFARASRLSATRGIVAR